METIDYWKKVFVEKVAEAFQELLERKHLYQNVQVDVVSLQGLIPEAVKRLSESSSQTSPQYWKRELAEGLNKISKTKWEFDSIEPNLNRALEEMRDKDNAPLCIPLPTIKTPCNNCDGVLPPHNHGYIGHPHQRESHLFAEMSETTQLFEGTYQCQNCKQEPLVFLILRKGLKLILVGRSQLQLVEIPKFVPKQIEKLYRNSVVAQRTGFILAAALYLRCAIEVFMRSAIKTNDRLPGEELAELYAKTLSIEFSNNFPSLKKAYSDLSAMLHTGTETDAEFQNYAEIKDAIEGHFEGLDVFKRRGKEKK